MLVLNAPDTAKAPVQKAPAENPDICTIEKPDAGETEIVALAADASYDLKFSLKDVQSVSHENGALECTFTDNAKIIFQTPPDTLSAQTGDVPSDSLSSLDVIDQLIAFMAVADGKIVEDDAAFSYQANSTIDGKFAQQMANIEPSSDTTADGPMCTVQTENSDTANAKLFDEITPAAGGGSGGGSHGGYGFESTPDAAPLNSLSAIGAIGPTSLQYSAEFYRPQGLDGKFASGQSVQSAPPSLSVNVTAQTIFIKEDGHGSVALTATAGNGTAQDVMTLKVTGVDSSWTVTAPGWTGDGHGTYTLVLAPGQTNYTGDFGFTPPANSDVDLTGLQFNAFVLNPVNGDSAGASDQFAVAVDAVVDTPTLNVPAAIQSSWYYYHHAYETPLNISSHVTDTDGSEAIDKIVLRLDNPFTLAKPPYQTLDDMGIGLNKGTETSPGVWEIQVHNGDATAALAGLKLVVPSDMNYGIIHGAGHQTDITVISYASEAHTSGNEQTLADNSTTVVQNIHLTFNISPLVLDLDGNGIDLVNIEHGVSFDMTNDGTLDRTSWVGAQDGLLALDINHDGLISNQSELFGDSAAAKDGFANLAQYDGNHDGRIDAQDAVYKDLIIWRDANQDGISQPGERSSLSDFNIAAINLHSIDTAYAQGDSVIIGESSFVYGDGHTGKIVDAAFNVRDGLSLNEGAHITGTSGNDTIYGTDNADTLTGGAGADKFMFDAIGRGVDVIRDFNTADGDVLDFSSFLQNYDAAQQSIDAFVFSRQVDGGTVISVDTSGSGNAANAVDVVALQGVHDVSVPDLVQNGNINVM